jgi:predicted  nucleic acid-binding Zn-ribbon protein
LKALTIRVEDEIFDKIELERGQKGRADYFRNLIESYFNESDSSRLAEELNMIRNESDKIKKELELNESKRINLANQIDSFKSQVSILEQQLTIQNESHKNAIKIMEQQLGFLQLEYQKLTDRLMLPAPKAWWQFWKK